MNKQSLILTAVFALGLFQAAFGDTVKQSGNDKPRGFLFYDDKQLPVIKTQPKKKQPEMQPEIKVSGSPQPAQQPAQPQPELFSVAWLQQNLPVLMENAINNPTVENVRAYKYAEKMMMDMAVNFANISEQVVANDPMLDQTVRFPVSAMARQTALWQVDRAKEEIVREMAKQGGIWFFFDSHCRFCDSQYKVVKLLEEKYPTMVVHYISTDGKTMAGMEKRRVRFDMGAKKAREIGIKLTPALVFAHTQSNTAMIIAHGASSMSEVEQKIVTVAIDRNLINPELVNIADLEKRGILTPDDIQRIKQEVQNPDDPNEIVRIINQAIHKRM